MHAENILLLPFFFFFFKLFYPSSNIALPYIATLKFQQKLSIELDRQSIKGAIRTKDYLFLVNWISI